MRRRTMPDASTTYVSGTPYRPKLIATVPEASLRHLDVGIAMDLQESRRGHGRVLVRDPQTGTPFSCSAISAGASCSHGMHQEAKKFTSVGLPAASTLAVEKPGDGGNPGKEKLGSFLPTSMLCKACGSYCPSCIRASSPQQAPPAAAATASGPIISRRRRVSGVMRVPP